MGWVHPTEKPLKTQMRRRWQDRNPAVVGKRRENDDNAGKPVGAPGISEQTSDISPKRKRQDDEKLASTATDFPSSVVLAVILDALSNVLPLVRIALGCCARAAKSPFTGAFIFSLIAILRN